MNRATKERMRTPRSPFPFAGPARRDHAAMLNEGNAMLRKELVNRAHGLRVPRAVEGARAFYAAARIVRARYRIEIVLPE